MNERLRIVQYITPSQIGGAEVHVATLAEKLRERGHDVTIICPRGRPLVGELISRRLPVWSPATFGKLDPVMLGRLAFWLRRHGVQVIHTHLSTASLIGSWAALMAGTRAVATVHGLNTRTCFNWAEAVIAVSNAVKQHLVSQGLPASRITVIHNGVDLRAMSASDAAAEGRAEWGAKEGAPLLVTVGRLAPTKGHRYLLEAVEMLARNARWRDLRLLIVGTGSLLPQLQREVEDRGLAERVGFCGFHRNVLPFLEMADVFVLPSVQEGLSLSALEAMALGKPVVACRVGGTPEVVVDGETGLLVAPADPAELASALEQLLLNPDLAHDMGMAGQRRVRDAFDLEQMVTKIERLYHTLIASGGAPA
jgi:glycosyltransferase involved in cell wall biosynthesis